MDIKNAIGSMQFMSSKKKIKQKALILSWHAWNSVEYVIGQGQTGVDVPGRKNRRLKTLKSTFRKIMRSLLNIDHGVEFKRGTGENVLDDGK